MNDKSSGASIIIDKVDIATEISKHVQLKPSKNELLGLCPFHNEDTPSFYVNPSKKLYYCFGCQAGGNVITFKAMINGITNADALSALAKEHNIQLGSENNNRVYYDTLNLAAGYYQKQLDLSQTAKAYLAERKLTPNDIQSFKIGYAQDGWRQLERIPQLNQNAAKKLGLIIDNPKGGYDRFRNRVIFPIISHHGQIIGFGGRSIGDEKPKYINSAESHIYHKGDILYGLYQALTQHAKHLIVVEGYMDVIALHKAGFTGAVAALGTAFTVSHFMLAARYAEKITFCFDGDHAGQNAQEKTFQNILPLIRDQVSCSFLSLPEEHDPDSYIQAHGEKAFQELLTNATPFSQYLLNHKLDKTQQSLEHKAKHQSHVRSLITQMPDSILKNLLSKEIGMPIANKKAPPRPATVSRPQEPTFIELLFQQSTALHKLPNDIQSLSGSLPPLAKAAWELLLKQPEANLANFLLEREIEYIPASHQVAALTEAQTLIEISHHLIDYQLASIDQSTHKLLQAIQTNPNKEHNEMLQKMLKLKHLLKKKKIILASC